MKIVIPTVNALHESLPCARMFIRVPFC
jgi:hypothetical protein